MTFCIDITDRLYLFKRALQRINEAPTIDNRFYIYNWYNHKLQTSMRKHFISLLAGILIFLPAL